MSRSIYTHLRGHAVPALTESDRQARIAERLRLERAQWQPPLFPVDFFTKTIHLLAFLRGV